MHNYIDQAYCLKKAKEILVIAMALIFVIINQDCKFR